MDALALYDAVVRDVLLHGANYDAATSELHGLEHWQRVARNGVALAAETEGADAEVVAAFAALHDSCRENDSHDPQHGPRAALLATRMHGAGALPLGEEQMHTLTRALRDHDRGQVSADPTIGCCWDADRLELPRVGIKVNPRFLSTAAGRNRAADARFAAQVTPHVGWRVWTVRVGLDSTRLLSPVTNSVWLPREPLVAKCTEHPGLPAPIYSCFCGVYAAPSVRYARHAVDVPGPRVAGRVSLGGKVFVGHAGHVLRGGSATIVDLYLNHNNTMAARQVAERLEAEYEVPVKVVDAQAYSRLGSPPDEIDPYDAKKLAYDVLGITKPRVNKHGFVI